MSKSEYKILSSDNEIIIKKKENKYKLEFKTNITNINSFKKIILTQKLYELFYLLNKDIIDNYESKILSDNESELIYLISLVEDDEFDEFDKYYIHTVNQLKIIENNENFFIAKINGNIKSEENNIEKIKYANHKKINLEDLSTIIHINIKENICDISLSFKLKNKTNIHLENILFRLFKKILYRMGFYLNK